MFLARFELATLTLEGSISSVELQERYTLLYLIFILGLNFEQA